MPVHCPECHSALVRSRRRGVGERVLLAPLAFLRPYRCSRCEYRGLRLSWRPTRLGALLFLLGLTAGVLLVQALWFFRVRAPHYRGAPYEPKDMERLHYLQQQEKEKPAVSRPGKE